MATVQIPQGTYKGLENDGVHIFHGVPYAAPFKRFSAPTPPKPANDQHDATSWGPINPQLPSRLSVVTGPMPADSGPQDELNCGVLSIYRPSSYNSSSSPLPVIIFIHGGAFITGSSECAWYEGASLARDANAVVVTINYRLGVFGFGPTEHQDDASPGVMDAIAGCRWVRNNISHFGGDAKNITGTGQSAGAYLIHVIFDVEPELLDKAILQSCPGLDLNPERREKVLRIVGESLPDGVTVETASTKELLGAQIATLKQLGGTLPPFLPKDMSDKYRVSEVKKKVLICWTETDGYVFAVLGGQDPSVAGPKITRYLFVDPSREHGLRWRKDGHDVTFYEFNWASEGFELGATHCTDLPLLLGHDAAWKDAPMIGKTSWDEWHQKGKNTRQMWGAFARDGTKPKDCDVLKQRD